MRRGALWLLLFSACPPPPPVGLAVDGDAQHGREVVIERGCQACHQIPGLRGVQGDVGPSLRGFARRPLIGGEQSNQPDHLITWLKDPPAFNPNTAMPNLDLDEREARDVAAFLYTLN